MPYLYNILVFFADSVSACHSEKAVCAEHNYSEDKKLNPFSLLYFLPCRLRHSSPTCVHTFISNSNQSLCPPSRGGGPTLSEGTRIVATDERRQAGTVHQVPQVWGWCVCVRVCGGGGGVRR